MRPEYTSIAIMRGGDMIFFRNRPEGDEESLTDLVHQTAMYYQDRLSGQGFARVLLGGSGRAARRRRHGAPQPRRAARDARRANRSDDCRALSDRISATADVIDVLAPLVGHAAAHAAARLVGV